MEKEYKISWLKVLGVVALIIILIGIIWLLYPKNNKSKGDTNTTFVNNITLMKEAGFEYFQGTNLPAKIGESNKITLEEMITSNLLVEFVDEQNNTCNTSDSYVKVTKSLDNEYTMKVFLSCNNKSDYIITTISETECPECESGNAPVSDNETNVEYYEDTEYKSSTNKSYKNNASSTSNKNNNTSNSGTSKNNITNVTNYNISYVNNCKNCTTSLCLNKCTYNIYHTVNFNSNGGTSVAKQIVKHGNFATYKISTREGYEFIGWYLDGEKYDFETPVTKKITLLAKWKKINEEKEEQEENKYTVKFDSNGGTKVPSEIVDEGDTATKPKNPTKECYEFAGWYTNSSLTNKYDFATPVTKDITLYAKWIDDGSCKNEYTVRFDSNGGTKVPSEIVDEGDTATKPKNPTKECYEFAGWYTNSSLTNKYDFATPVTKDITLYAKWIDDGSCKNEYTVKFDSNGGTKVKSQTVEEGDRAFEPKEPTRSGYEFIGWYLDGKKYSFNSRIYEDITLDAKWEKEEQKYHTYCSVNEKTYYSTTYVFANGNTSYYDWTIKFKDLRNVEDLKITNVGYLTTTSRYNKAYEYYVNGADLTNANGNSDTVSITSGSMLNTYSLKSSNFTKVISNPYYKNGYWYANVAVSISNYNNVTKYYASNIKSYIYFVPFYFEVEYTDLNDCTDDLASNSSKYDDYKITDTFYK